MTPSASIHNFNTWVRTSGTWRLWAASPKPDSAAIHKSNAIARYGESNVKQLHPITKH